MVFIPSSNANAATRNAIQAIVTVAVTLSESAAIPSKAMSTRLPEAKPR
jgi:hypothetical protein